MVVVLLFGFVALGMLLFASWCWWQLVQASWFVLAIFNVVVWVGWCVLLPGAGDNLFQCPGVCACCIHCVQWVGFVFVA